MLHARLSATLTIILTISALVFGCSGTADITDPATPDIIQSTSQSPVSESQSINPHATWGIWWIYLDPEEPSWEIIPARFTTFHANIRGFLEDGNPCTNCFQITNFQSNPDGTKSIDIQITHPWAGFDRYTGFDVRAVAMWNGSQVWPSTGLRTQDFFGTDGYILNADGFTTIFNPTDFPEGSSVPLLTYSKGTLATLTTPDSTLNPYIDYYTDENRHMFRAGQAVTKTWEVRLPTDGPFVFGYAVDASWEPPDTDPPVNLPDDFPIHANKPEPWKLEIEQEGPLDAVAGAQTNIVVTVWDWMNNTSGVWIECPELWSGKKFDMMTSVGPDYTVFYIPITNATGAGEGSYQALVGSNDTSSTPPPWDFTTYDFTFINVETIINLPPVAAAEADQYTVYTDDLILFTSLSTDPNGPGDIIQWRWDFENDDTWDSGMDNPTWSYGDPGTYLVDHKVMDQGGLEDDLEPDELLEITVLDQCCENPPVAVIDGPADVITDQVVTLTSASYDPDGDECLAEISWDLDGDGVYDQSGDEVIVSWDTIGTYEVGLKVSDNCGLEDITTLDITVHVGITQLEDLSYKIPGTRYSYVSADYSAADAAFAVDMANLNGPWDFTQLVLTDTDNYRAILDKDHPEVASFKDDFPTPYDHFYKTEGIYYIVTGAVYIAEQFATGPDRLLWVGIHENSVIGSVPFAPVMEQDYPFWIFSDYYYYFGFPPIFTFFYDLVGWGEGLVTVPYNGITDEPCVVVKYMLGVDSPSLSGTALAYEWILDDGTVVAVVAAINMEDENNFDEETGEITGIATFNALYEVGLY